MTPYEMRQKACDWLAENKEYFQDCFAGGRDALLRHVARMRGDDWGTAFEATAIANILRRPIHLVTDHDRDESCITLCEPLKIVAAETWGILYTSHIS